MTQTEVELQPQAQWLMTVIVDKVGKSSLLSRTLSIHRFIEFSQQPSKLTTIIISVRQNRFMKYLPMGFSPGLDFVYLVALCLPPKYTLAFRSLGIGLVQQKLKSKPKSVFLNI